MLEFKGKLRQISGVYAQNIYTKEEIKKITELSDLRKGDDRGKKGLHL